MLKMRQTFSTRHHRWLFTSGCRLRPVDFNLPNLAQVKLRSKSFYYSFSPSFANFSTDTAHCIKSLLDVRLSKSERHLSGFVPSHRSNIKAFDSTRDRARLGQTVLAYIKKAVHPSKNKGHWRPQGLAEALQPRKEPKCDAVKRS